MKNNSQLVLDFDIRKAARFENFISDNNESLINDLMNDKQFCIFYYGASGSGKTHLMHSLCHEYSVLSKSVTYLPLAQYDEFSSDMFSGLENMDLVCIDDIQVVIGLSDWEHELFHFYNKVRDNNGRIVVSSALPLKSLSFQLDDLCSRFSWGPVYQVKLMNDKNKRIALQQQAVIQGIELSDDVCEYLLTRYSRDVSSLFEFLETLDTASLVAQRKITIPFIRKILSNE